MTRATTQDGSYPRPMLCRDDWTSLDGTWMFAYDDANKGLTARWFDPSVIEPFNQEIQVPYPPESPASGIANREKHSVFWYRRDVSHEQLVGDVKGGHRVLIHFGAVDHRAQVWFNGQLVAAHVGGQTPFSVDVTDLLTQDRSQANVLVVRAEDDPDDLEQPRGKQSWRDKPHGIWYERTSGIWQPVWSETVPIEHIVDVTWIAAVEAGLVRAEITLAATPSEPLALDVSLRLDDEPLGRVSCTVMTKTTSIDVPIAALRNGQDRARFAWSPESPTLVDAEVVLRRLDSAEAVDTIVSYMGLRTVSVGGGTFLLNGQPYYTRSVLNQGYRPQTHLASLGTSELRGEVELIKAMGFNAVRVHQKAEDPRFLYWADRLGLLVWGETAGAYEFSPRAVVLLTTEWMDLVRRDRSHPSIVAWVPVNESWGVQDISTVAAQQQYAQALASLTRALDPDRPVISNDGWEHVDSDIVGLHDYMTDPAVLRARYLDKPAATAMTLSGHGPQGRRPLLNEPQKQRFLAGDAPLMITEFGGVSMSEDDESWGYKQVDSTTAYSALLTSLFDALRASSEVSGFCYTQYMDTGQETNGLLFANGTTKLPVEDIRRIVTGNDSRGRLEPTSTFGAL